MINIEKYRQALWNSIWEKFYHAHIIERSIIRDRRIDWMILSSPIPNLYLLAQPAPPIAIEPIPENENDTEDDDGGSGSNTTASNNN
jgi:hypothetical protein